MTAILLAAALLVSPTADTDATAMIVEKIAALDATLNDDQRSALHLGFDDEARTGWSFFPGDRKGLVLDGLSDEQVSRVLDVVRACLSESGFETAEAIRMLEDVLYVMEDNNPGRDKTKYYLAVFGEASNDAPWSLRWEGHHLSLNWTIINGKIIASSPQFLGSNPAEVPEGPHKGLRVLAAEEDLARELVAALNEEQRAKAIIHDKAPSDILTRMQSEAKIQKDAGLGYGEMTEAQQGVLLNLIELLASVQLPAVAEARLAGVREGGLEKVKFAWMGGTEKGQGHYYRVQGPSFLIEYDSTQNDANHVHLVWRDFDGDFGRDVLAEHYAVAH